MAGREGDEGETYLSTKTGDQRQGSIREGRAGREEVSQLAVGVRDRDLAGSGRTA